MYGGLTGGVKNARGESSGTTRKPLREKRPGASVQASQAAAALLAESSQPPRGDGEAYAAAAEEEERCGVGVAMFAESSVDRRCNDSSRWRCVAMAGGRPRMPASDRASAERDSARRETAR